MPEKQSDQSAADTAPTRSGTEEPRDHDLQDDQEGVKSGDSTGIDPQEPIDPKSPKLVTP